MKCACGLVGYPEYYGKCDRCFVNAINAATEAIASSTKETVDSVYVREMTQTVGMPSEEVFAQLFKENNDVDTNA